MSLDIDLFHKKREGSAARRLIVLFFLSSIVVFAAFMPMLLRNHYSSDSYHLIKDQHVLWYLQCGRYTFWWFASILDGLGANLVLAQRWLIAFCMVSLAGSIAAFAYFLERIANLGGSVAGTFLILPVSLIWCNVYLEDWILFPEVAGMIALAAISLTMSVIVFFRAGSPLNLLLSALLLLVSLGAYQSMVGSYIAATVIVSCFAHRENLRAKVLSSLKGIVIGGFCAVLNILILKALIASGMFGESGRGSSFDVHVILSNLVHVAQYQLSFWKDADGLLPCPLMQVLEVVLCALFVSAFRREGRSAAVYLVAFLVSLGAAYAPHYVEATIMMSPRSNVAVWMAIGCTIAVLWCDCCRARAALRPGAALVSSTPTTPPSRCLLATACALSLFAVLSFVFMWDIAYDVYASNVQDRGYATAVAASIRRYEDETGIAVHSIGIVGDASVEDSYQETRYRNHELGVRIMNVSYSRVEMINWLGSLDLQQADVPKAKARELFGRTDWDELNLDEQLKFEGDVAYLAVY